MSLYNKPKQHKRKLYRSILDVATFILAFLFLIGMALYIINNTPEEKKEPKNDVSIKDTFYEENSVQKPLYTKVSEPLKTVKVENHAKRSLELGYLEKPVTPIQNESEVSESGFTYYENIPLKEETQRYIWELAEETGVSYELILAVAKVESNFDPNAISSTGDYGLMQINKPSGTMNWLVDFAGIDNFQWNNPRHSAEAAATYIAYLKGKWQERGVSDVNVVKGALTSYNMGDAGARRYIRNNGFNWSYAEKVIEQRENILKGEL